MGFADFVRDFNESIGFATAGLSGVVAGLEAGEDDEGTILGGFVSGLAAFSSTLKQVTPPAVVSNTIVAPQQPIGRNAPSPAGAGITGNLTGIAVIGGLVILVLVLGKKFG